MRSKSVIFVGTTQMVLWFTKFELYLKRKHCK